MTKISKSNKALVKMANERRKRAYIKNYEFYAIRSLLGYYPKAFLIYLLGGREVGKSYVVTKFYVCQWKKMHRPFYWLRLTDKSAAKLLMNNAEKLVDPDIRRSFKLDLATDGDTVYDVIKRDAEGKIVEKKLMCRVLALSTFYNDKGSGLFDKDFLLDPDMFYNICLDEMNREQNERKTFDILYAFVNQLENLVRSTKQRMRIILIGNTLEEASDLLTAVNFIPEEFGRYYLARKRAVIDYIPPSEKYLARRKGTIADILLPKASTFTNEITTDDSLVSKGRLTKPATVIKFSKETAKWFTVWDAGVIATYKNERCKDVISMRPYIDELFSVDRRDSIILMFDTRTFRYTNLITFKKFQKELSLLKPRK